MTDVELAEISQALDAALAVFQKHKGSLTASEISMKSMLLALRLQLGEELRRART